MLNILLIKGKKTLLAALDYAILLFSLLLAHIFFEYRNCGFLPTEKLSLWIIFLVFVLFIQLVIFQIADLYSIPRKHKKAITLQTIPLAICTILVFLNIAIFCYWTKFSLGRDVLLMATFLSCIFSLGIRLVLIQLFSPKYLALIKPIKCLILGSGPLADELAKENKFLHNYQAFSLLNYKIDDFQAQKLSQIIQEENLELILLNSETLSEQIIDELIKAKFAGLEVIEIGTFYEKLTSRVPLLHLPNNWFLNGQVFNQVANLALLRAKRIFDLSFVFLLAPAVIPLIIFSSIIIQLTSKGAALYQQKRVGLCGQIFTVYKLRSMVIDSEKAGIQWTTEKDPRITPFGRLIRASRIDELPQLWNILKGEMSLIGPRPERPEFVESLRKQIPYYDLRHSVLPGLSGWAQVNEPLATPSDSLQKLEFDLFYIRHLSFWLELDIILRTIRIVLMRKGH